MGTIPKVPVTQGRSKGLPFFFINNYLILKVVIKNIKR